MPTDLDDLQRRIRAFATERDWERYHSPKNIAMALIGEAGELIEHFQWLTEEQSATLPPDKLNEVRLEMADVFIYLVRLADRLGIDLMQAAEDKIVLNAQKYPVEKVRGSSKKYNEY